MCGIFAILKNKYAIVDFKKDLSVINKIFNKGQSRGPENSSLNVINDNILYGFHRLAINGLDDISNQPITHKGIYLICNGEIYNYKQIFSQLSVNPVTNSDCEAIIHLYLKYGIDYTVQNLDGVFSFVLFDSNNNTGYIARDPYGVRPLFYGFGEDFFICASLLKQIGDIVDDVHTFEPGSYMKFNILPNNNISITDIPYKYNTFNYNHNYPTSLSTVINHSELEKYYVNIYNDLFNAVKKRVITMETNLACLLSGGLDSSLITALVSKFIPKNQLQTYSIGMIGGSDLKYASAVSKHINSKHTEIILSEHEFFSTIPEVIYNIESYDTTTVRASVGNYLVAKYISENSDAKVIFNGDGSDELTGGYLYFHNCPSDIEFDHECKRLLKELHYFDVLRSDRSISCHGLEARTPFLDRSFVSNYLQIPIRVRNHNNFNTIEKYLLRNSVKYCDPHLLPDDVLWRKKEAFSDGVSSTEKSWYEIIQDTIDSIYSDDEYNILIKKYSHNTPTTKEQLYYREIFNKHFPNKDEIIPHFWMPKYCNSTDSSARSLDIYNKPTIIDYLTVEDV